MKSSVNFGGKKIWNNSCTGIHNIFVYIAEDLAFLLKSPITCGLPDHDAEYLMINNIASADNIIPVKQRPTI
jgi:hypothetical protein